uniref:Uncharacterized protein n=1 Tax=Anguilla anguilla TaxID=7936 RepID=A0A0E9SPC1_ANGAN
MSLKGGQQRKSKHLVKRSVRAESGQALT